jgi:hypothetical protein
MKVFSTKSVGALALAAQAVNGVETTSGFDVFKYVDPLIGTANGGKIHSPQELFYTTNCSRRSRVCRSNSALWWVQHLPMRIQLLIWIGMAKAVADVDDPDEKEGGFASGDSSITGFSHMHDSGTGGVRTS